MGTQAGTGKAPWYQFPILRVPVWLWISMVLVLALGIGIGLGVMLGAGTKTKPSVVSESPIQESAPAPMPALLGASEQTETTKQTGGAGDNLAPLISKILTVEQLFAYALIRFGTEDAKIDPTKIGEEIASCHRKFGSSIGCPIKIDPTKIGEEIVVQGYFFSAVTSDNRAVTIIHSKTDEVKQMVLSGATDLSSVLGIACWGSPITSPDNPYITVGRDIVVLSGRLQSYHPSGAGSNIWLEPCNISRK